MEQAHSAKRIFLLFSIYAFGTCLGANNPDACGQTNVDVGENGTSFVFPNGGKVLEPTLCDYTFTTSVADAFLLFQIESISLGNSATCTDDYVVVGDNDHDIQQKTYIACGTAPPTWIFFSKGQSFKVQVKVKSQLDKAKLNAAIKLLPPNLEQNPQCGPSVLRVGASPTDFSSPKAGTGFNESTTCFYVIGGRKPGPIGFEITNMKIGNSPKCETDYVIVTDLIDKPEGGKRFCGEKAPSAFETNKNIILVEVNIKTTPKTDYVKGRYYEVPGSSGLPVVTTNCVVLLVALMVKTLV